MDARPLCRSGICEVMRSLTVLTVTQPLIAAAIALRAQNRANRFAMVLVVLLSSRKRAELGDECYTVDSYFPDHQRVWIDRGMCLGRRPVVGDDQQPRPRGWGVNS